jgi:hypothetical protein
MNKKNWKKVEKISIALAFIVPIPVAIIFVNLPRGTSINGFVAGLIITQCTLVFVSSIARRMKG